MRRAVTWALLACFGVACTRRDDARAVRGPVESAEGRCPRFRDPERVGSIDAPAIVEASGLAASLRHPGVLWTHNDSGDSARVFALRADGSLAATVTLDGVVATDIEDIAVAPCAEGSCVFVADIGDNATRRAEVSLHRFAEPAVLADGAARVFTIRFRYEDGPHNAEALLVDPLDAAVFVVTKEKAGPSTLFRVPEGGGVAKRKGALTPPLGSNLVTAGSFAADRSRVVLRTYTHAFLYAVRGGEPLAEALARPPCVVPAPAEQQGEAIAFTAAGALRFVGEGERVPIYEAAPLP
jgi:hypothetical protein